MTGRTHTSPLGTTFKSPSADEAGWIQPAVEVLAAFRARDLGLLNETLNRHTPTGGLDVTCGLAVIAYRLLSELPDPDGYLADLGLELARAQSDAHE